MEKLRFLESKLGASLGGSYSKVNLPAVQETPGLIPAEIFS